MVSVANYSAKGGLTIFPPLSVIDRLLSGYGFGNKTLYSVEEIARLEEDRKGIITTIFSQKILPSKQAILAIGPLWPEKLKGLKSSADLKGYAYICPEDLLEQLQQTYGSDCSSMGEEGARQKWRPAANAVAYLTLQKLVNLGNSFVWVSKTAGILQSSGYLDKYSVKIVHFTNFGDGKLDSSLGKIGPIFPSYIYEIEFLRLFNKFIEYQLHWIGTLKRIKGSHKFELSIVDVDRYKKLRSLYDTVARENGWASWQEVIEARLPE